MDYKKITAVAVLLAAVSFATVTDGIDGLGLNNAARTAIWKEQKRLEAGITVKSDRNATDGEWTRDIVRGGFGSDFANAPWVNWTDTLGDGMFYGVGLENEAWKNKSETQFDKTALNFEIAKDFGGLIGGINLGYTTLSTKDKDFPADKLTSTTTSQPLTLGFGVAKVIDSKQMVLLGYETGMNHTATTKVTKVKKNVEEDVIQDTSVALGYVYTVNNALQLGAQAISTWSWDYDPTETLGVAVSYLPMNALELQGYLNYTQGVGAKHNLDKDWDDNGRNVTNYGVNATYALAFGDITAGIDITDRTWEREDWENDIIKYSDTTAVGTIGYKYLF